MCHLLAHRYDARLFHRCVVHVRPARSSVTFPLALPARRTPTSKCIDSLRLATIPTRTERAVAVPSSRVMDTSATGRQASSSDPSSTIMLKNRCVLRARVPEALRRDTGAACPQFILASRAGQ
jgi:hypothetical protein